MIDVFTRERILAFGTIFLIVIVTVVWSILFGRLIENIRSVITGLIAGSFTWVATYRCLWVWLYPVEQKNGWKAIGPGIALRYVICIPVLIYLFVIAQRAIELVFF